MSRTSLSYAARHAAAFPVGAVVYCGYWRSFSRVVATMVDGDRWSVTAIDCDAAGQAKAGARQVTHCTPFDPKRDRIVTA